MRLSRSSTAAACILTTLFGAASAWARPDHRSSVVNSEPNGSEGLCPQPCFIALTRWDVYLAGNDTGPVTCGEGENLYVYFVTHIGGEPAIDPIGTPGNILPINSFEVEVPPGAIAHLSAGSVADGGMAPTTVVINDVENVVTWSFEWTPIFRWYSSDPLYLCSPLGPGPTTIGIDSPLSLSAPGPGVGPRTCGLGFELALLIPGLAWLRGRRRGRAGVDPTIY